MSKFTVGRLRPHFLNLCNPILDDELCKSEDGYPKFVEGDARKIENLCQSLKNANNEEERARIDKVNATAIMSS